MQFITELKYKMLSMGKDRKLIYYADPNHPLTIFPIKKDQASSQSKAKKWNQLAGKSWKNKLTQTNGDIDLGLNKGGMSLWNDRPMTPEDIPQRYGNVNNSVKNHKPGFVERHPYITSTALIGGGLIAGTFIPPVGAAMEAVGMAAAPEFLGLEGMTSAIVPQTARMMSVGLGYATSAFKFIKGTIIGNDKQVILKNGMYHLNPKDIKFTQPNVGTHFSNGKSLNETIQNLRSGNLSPSNLPPIQVVQTNGKLFSIDNRRLLVFNAARINKIPVEIISLNSPNIALKFANRFNPILDEGNFAIIVNKAMRNSALKLLEEKNMIRKNYDYK